MTVTTQHTNHSVEPPDRLLPLAKALDFVGVSRSKLYLLLNADEFPKPVKIGRSNYFSNMELQQWITAQLQERVRGES